MTTAQTAPFPKLSQAWRAARLFGAAFGGQAAAGLAHIAWADRAAVAAVAVGAAETAYRQAFPTGKLSGQLAALVAAYRQISAAATPATVGAPAITAAAPEITTPVDLPPTPPAA